MFGLGKKIFQKNVGEMKTEIKKMEKRDLMEAIIAGCLLIASADGEIEDSETKALDAMLQAHPAMGHYGTEITKTIQGFTAKLKAGSASAKVAIMREIGDIKNIPADAEEAFAFMVDIAMADGEIEEAEKVVLTKIAAVLGQRLSDFGI